MARTGLVVAGAGARGAYEAGALSVLLPRLGARPDVLVGTSAGAINVVGLAATADRGLEQSLTELVALWSDVVLGDVVDLPGTLAGGLRLAGQVAGLPTEVPSLLDTSPQRETLEQRIPFDALHDNVRSGRVGSVAVVTTSVQTGGTVVFVESAPGTPLPPPDPDRDLTYVATELTVEHVLASSAVPAAFRPVEVTTPGPWRGWYVDGGLRLNAPLSPALDLGAERLAVVATQPAAYGPTGPPVTGPRPDVAGVVGLALRSLLADRMVEDLRVLTRVNRLLAAGARGTGHREVPFLFAGPGPGQEHDLGRLASARFRAAYGGVKALRNPALAVLERLLGGAPDDNGELLSYLFFDRAFTGAAAALGAEHASATADGWRLAG